MEFQPEKVSALRFLLRGKKERTERETSASGTEKQRQMIPFIQTEADNEKLYWFNLLEPSVLG
jgi:hypothetical protein